MNDTPSDVTPGFLFRRILVPTRSSILVQILLPIVGHFLAELSALKLAAAAFLIAYSVAYSVDYLPPFPFSFPDTFLAQSPNAVFALACALSTFWPRLLNGLGPVGAIQLQALYPSIVAGAALIAATTALYGLSEYLRDRRDDAVDLEEAFPTHYRAIR
jgi:hypothetical protein